MAVGVAFFAAFAAVAAPPVPQPAAAVAVVEQVCFKSLRTGRTLDDVLALSTVVRPVTRHPGEVANRVLPRGGTYGSWTAPGVYVFSRPQPNDPGPSCQVLVTGADRHGVAVALDAWLTAQPETLTRTSPAPGVPLAWFDKGLMSGEYAAPGLKVVWFGEKRGEIAISVYRTER